MDALKRLGITDLPDYNRADLSALTDLDAFLSEAKQLARVKVDEEGVEAAAVTLIEVKPSTAHPSPQRCASWTWTGPSCSPSPGTAGCPCSPAW